MHTTSYAGQQSADGAELVGNMLAHLTAGAPLDPDTARAWADGIVASVRRGESLDTSLGLSASGRRTLQTRLLHLRRDDHLKEAAAAVSLDPALSTWLRCLRLVPLIRTFVDREWRAVRLQADPPDDWPVWKVHLFRAMQTDLALPRSPRGVYDVVQRAQACSTRRSGARLLSHYL